MLSRIKGNIVRQEKGLGVLFTLLEEEFSLLRQHEPSAVSGCEFSIQELLRQLAVERGSLRGMVRELVPGARAMADVLPNLDAEEAQAIAEIMDRVDALEQRCAIQAEKNAQLAFALADQSRNMLDFMHKRIQPKGNDVYSARGRVSKSGHPEAALFRGRS